MVIIKGELSSHTGSISLCVLVCGAHFQWQCACYGVNLGRWLRYRASEGHAYMQVSTYIHIYIYIYVSHSRHTFRAARSGDPGIPITESFNLKRVSGLTPYHHIFFRDPWGTLFKRSSSTGKPHLHQGQGQGVALYDQTTAPRDPHHRIL